MVIRETPAFSVRPTVKESMLKARRRNSDATRVSTPGLFSTCTTKVLSIGTCGTFRTTLECGREAAAIPSPPPSPSTAVSGMARRRQLRGQNEGCRNLQTEIQNYNRKSQIAD